MSWFISLAVLSVLIFVHELGHYLAARYFGVYVEIFSIGFGKKLFSFYFFDTQWRISAIPLGGYVKMKGQDDTDPTKRSNENDSYNTKKPWQRIIILLAGPGMNFVIAYLFFFMIGLGGPMEPSAIIGKVLPDSPAQKAGLLKDDKVLAINRVPINSWQDLSENITNSNGALELKIERQNQVKVLLLTPTLRETTNEFNESIQKKMIGIGASGAMQKRPHSFIDAFTYANERTLWASTMIFLGVQKLITGVVPADQLGGVVSIVKITSDATQYGWMSLFFVAALLSVNLGILNLFPIPALDGGHIMFNLYEWITSHAPSETILMRLTMVGWVLLIGLMSLGLYNDIHRLIQ